MVFAVVIIVFVVVRSWIILLNVLSIISIMSMFAQEYFSVYNTEVYVEMWNIPILWR